MPNKHKCISADYSLYEIPRGLTARIAGFHPAGPGSTPGVGKTIFEDKIFLILCTAWDDISNMA